MCFGARAHQTKEMSSERAYSGLSKSRVSGLLITKEISALRVSSIRRHVSRSSFVLLTTLSRAQQKRRSQQKQGSSVYCDSVDFSQFRSFAFSFRPDAIARILDNEQIVCLCE